MNIQQLQSLNLESRWPKLARLQKEIASLEKRHHEADARVGSLRAGLPAARERDLVAQAVAVRSGKDAPAAKHEPEAQENLERANRDRDVMARALQSAQEDLSDFLARHQAELYQDVLEARHKIAKELSKDAQAALSGFARWADLYYPLRDLTPAAPVQEGAEAQKLTQTIVGIQTTRSSGPDRGEVESLLQYLIGLGGDDAAA